MGLMDGILEVLGGFNAVKQIDADGFDFREKRAQEEFLRRRQQELAQQSDEDRALKVAGDVYAGSEGDQVPDVSALFPAGMDEQRKRLYIESLAGGAKERRSALKAQDVARQEAIQRMRGTQGLDQIGARGNEQRKTLEGRQEWEDTRKPSPRDEAGWAAAMARVAEAVGGRGQGGGLRKPYWNLAEKRTDFLTNEELGSVPPGTYTDIVSGRQGAGAEQQKEGMEKIVRNLDTALSGYEATQEGMGRVTPSFLSPSKAVAWDRYRSALQSAGQAFGRKVLNDTRVSNEDRIAYAKTIGQTSELMTMLDPTEARRRAASFFDTVQDYEAKYGSGGAPTSDGGETAVFGGVTYRLRPGADRRKKSSWEAVR